MSPIDLFALSMLGILGIAFLILLSIILIVRKNSSCEPDEVDEVIEESVRKRPAPSSSSPRAEKEPPRDPWEKDPDWWNQ